MIKIAPIYITKNTTMVIVRSKFVSFTLVKMLPFSFKEFTEATKQKNNLSASYKDYVSTSSFPYVLELLDTPQEINPYLEGIYNTILVKDIIDRKKITDTTILKSVTHFLFDNIGMELSSKKIADTLTSNNRKSDPKTIEKIIPFAGLFMVV